MAGPAPSHESGFRRVTRFALGTTVSFLLAQTLGWPFAFLCPVLTLILLIESEPLAVRDILAIVRTAIMALVLGYVLALVLLPYPALLVATACLLMYRFFIYIMTSGAHILAIVFTLIGMVLIPVVVKLLPELAVIAGVGVMTSLLVAIVVSWSLFLFLPAPPAPPDPHHHGPMNLAEAEPLARTMTLVAGPLLIFFLLTGSTKILVLVYATLIATALSDTDSVKMSIKFVTANLLIGGIGVYLFYESLVAVPNIAFMIVLAITFLLFCGNKVFSDSPSAALWFSGTIGFLFLIGGALPSDKAVPAAKTLDRVIQIGVASLYVIFAYRVIDLFQGVFSRSRKL